MSCKSKGISILHVDDDITFLDSAKSILELNRGLKVTSVNSVDYALKLIDNENFDVIVSDYEMSTKNGLQFLKILRDQGIEIPFLLFTGKGREEVAITALNLGADGYVNKFGSSKTVFGELIHYINRAVKHKKNQIALKKSEEKYRTVVENSDQAILVFQNGFYRFANEKAEELSGYTTKELLSLVPLSLVHPEDIECVAKLTTKYEQLRNAGNRCPQEDSFRFITKDKQTKWVALKSLGIMWDGKPASLNFFTDITKEKDVERALRESEKMHRLLTENITDTIFIQDMSLRVKYVSPSIKALAGYSPEEVLKLKTEDFMTPESYTRGVSDFMNALELGKEGKDSEIPLTQYQYIRKNGTTFWGELRTNLMRDSEGNLIGLQGTLRDITERKIAEQNLTKAVQDLREANEKLNIIGKLTRHDAQNKLFNISNRIFLIEKKLGLNNSIKDDLEEIKSIIDQIEKIFSLARIHEKLGTEELFKNNVERIFNETTTSLPDEIQVFNECKGLIVHADSLLPQIFGNLIENSIKHGEKVTQIRLYYKEEKDHIKLIYEDNGVGITETEKNKIFNEGYGKGTGYGLFLIEKICQAYNWKISEIGELDKGAKFVITLPSE